MRYSGCTRSGETVLARRGKGEGSIFQRSDGRWCAQVSDGYGPSGRKRSYVYGKTRVEVARKLTEALAAKQNGVRKTITDKRVTVAQWSLCSPVGSAHRSTPIGRSEERRVGK